MVQIIRNSAVNRLIIIDELTPAQIAIITVLTAPEIDDGNSGTADTIDFSAGAYHKSTLTGNVTYTFTAPPAPIVIQLKVVQGAGPYTVTWPASVLWPGNIDPILSQGSGDVDIFTFYYDGTSYWSKGVQFALA